MLSETKTGGVLERGWAHPAGSFRRCCRAGIGHAAAASAMMSASALLSCVTFSSVAPFFLRFQREGVVGSISARRQISDIGMRCAFARSKSEESGSACSITRHVIGRPA